MHRALSDGLMIVERPDDNILMSKSDPQYTVPFRMV